MGLWGGGAAGGRRRIVLFSPELVVGVAGIFATVGSPGDSDDPGDSIALLPCDPPLLMGRTMGLRLRLRY